MARSKGMSKSNVIRGFTIGKTHYFKKQVRKKYITGYRIVHYHFRGLFNGKQVRNIIRISKALYNIAEKRAGLK